MPKPILNIDHVSFDYGRSQDAEPLVERWSDQFQAGTVTAITGPSGCGKSTRLYLLALMLRIGSGSIEIEGVRVDNLSDSGKAAIRANQFGFVFQDAALDPTRSVLDNVLETSLYRHVERAASIPRARELLDELGVAVPISRRPGQVSGGQAHRIALSRALLSNPRILVADEPTGNLDDETADVVLQRMRTHANSGGCVIVVTHDSRVADWADLRLDLSMPT